MKIKRFEINKFKNDTNVMNDFQLKNNSENTNDHAYLNYSSNTQIKSLIVLSYSYFQVLIIIVIMIAFLIPIYSLSYNFIVKTNETLIIQNYLLGKCLRSSVQTIQVKCLLSSNCYANRLEYESGLIKSETNKLIYDTNDYGNLTMYYDNYYLLNICQFLYNSTNQTLQNSLKNLTTCMEDTNSIKVNDTDTLFAKIDNYQYDLNMESNYAQNYIFNNVSYPFQARFLFQNKIYGLFEHFYYNYIIQVSEVFSNIFISSINYYANSKKNQIYVLIVFFAISVLCFCLYVSFVYTEKLIHYLKVSRCILKIIPTHIIFTTNDIKNWIELKV